MEEKTGKGKSKEKSYRETEIEGQEKQAEQIRNTGNTEGKEEQAQEHRMRAGLHKNRQPAKSEGTTQAYIQTKLTRG